MFHGETCLSQSSPVKYLESFLQQYSPVCNNKWVVLNQGGELYGNLDVQNLFKGYQYEIYPTSFDSSYQNSPVERAHCTVSNDIKSFLVGADLPIAYWPYAFLRVLRIQNALPGNGQSLSPIHLSTGKKINLENLRTFGCRVWVGPLGIQAKSFRDNAQKESSLIMFLTQHEISSGMMLNFKDVKLRYIVYLTKDSMMFISSLFLSTHSICFVLQLEMILLNSKILLMQHLIWRFVSILSHKSKQLLFMYHLLKMILHLILK